MKEKQKIGDDGELLGKPKLLERQLFLSLPVFWLTIGGIGAVAVLGVMALVFGSALSRTNDSLNALAAASTRGASTVVVTVVRYLAPPLPSSTSWIPTAPGTSTAPGTPTTAWTLTPTARFAPTFGLMLLHDFNGVPAYSRLYAYETTYINGQRFYNVRIQRPPPQYIQELLNVPEAYIGYAPESPFVLTATPIKTSSPAPLVTQAPNLPTPTAIYLPPFNAILIKPISSFPVNTRVRVQYGRYDSTTGQQFYTVWIFLDGTTKATLSDVPESFLGYPPEDPITLTPSPTLNSGASPVPGARPDSSPMPRTSAEPSPAR